VQLEDMAWECRTLANVAVHAEVREQLLEIAEQFERLARHHREIKTITRLKAEC
jgi:hypothetical protein